MRVEFPFFWHRKGLATSLQALPLSPQVVQKNDVTSAVGEKKSGIHPLIVAELAGGKIIGDLRLATTSDDVVVSDVQTVFGCDNPDGHYALKRLRFRLPKSRRGT